MGKGTGKTGKPYSTETLVGSQKNAPGWRLLMSAMRRRRLHKLIREVRQVYEDGEFLPYLIPRRAWRDHMDFDRAVCATGLKDYVRPIMPSDHPNPARARSSGPVPQMPPGTNALRIRELARGIRTRLSCTISFPKAGVN
jgi:hypothetical protein